jgi:hypothetical protein
LPGRTERLIRGTRHGNGVGCADPAEKVLRHRSTTGPGRVGVKWATDSGRPRKDMLVVESSRLR